MKIKAYILFHEGKEIWGLPQDFPVSLSWWEIELNKMYSKQFHFRSLEEKKWEEEEEEEGKNSSPVFPTSATIFLVPWRTSQALFRFFFLHKAMCHRQGFSIFILINLHFPHLCAGSPHFHMLQMSAGLSSSLNRHTNSTSDHSAKPFYPHTASAKLLKCWWSQKQKPGGLSKAHM